MQTTRRYAAAMVSAIALIGLLPGMAHAASKTLKLLVGYPAGGAVDVVARQVSQELRQVGYTVIVENKTGAAGRLATNDLLGEPADGSTIILMPSGNVTLFPYVYHKLRYKLSDLAPLATVCSFDFALGVGRGTPAKTLKEFIAWSKANPSKSSYGTPGAGTAMDFLGMMLAKDAHFQFTSVPYRGGAAVMGDVLSGTIPAILSTLPNLVPEYKGGTLRILALSGKKRLASLPDVPTFKELGFPNMVVTERFGFFASAKVPEATQAELEKALMTAASNPRVVTALGKLGFDSDVTGRVAYRTQLEVELKRWGPIVKETGYNAQN